VLHFSFEREVVFTNEAEGSTLSFELTGCISHSCCFLLSIETKLIAVCLLWAIYNTKMLVQVAPLFISFVRVFSLFSAILIQTDRDSLVCSSASLSFQE